MTETVMPELSTMPLQGTDTPQNGFPAQLRALDERLMTVEHALQELSEIKPAFDNETRDRVLAVLDKYFPQGA